jgi:DNA ligase (NAD+)
LSVKYILQPLLCPICGEPLYEHGTDSITLVCENSKCSGKILNKLEHMYGKKGLDVKGISVATLEKFLDWGYISKPADLYCLSEKQWKELGIRK